jgi:hypothetical protein
VLFDNVRYRRITMLKVSHVQNSLRLYNKSKNEMTIKEQYEFCDDMRKLFARASKEIFDHALENKLVKRTVKKETWVDGFYRKSYNVTWK